MRHQISKFICAIFILLSSTLILRAQTKTEGVITDTLRIGVSGNEPFVYEGNAQGIALEIWDRIAEKKGWHCQYTSYDTVDKALIALDEKEVDLLVGPISITSERVENFKFSQPFYNSSISIISRIGNQSIWQKVKPLFSIKLLMAVGIFLIILAGVGTLLWLAERKASPEQFSHDPIKGIGTGMWLAIVTMSTTGYGDKAAVTLTGRIISGAWMIISIIFATSMVAGIASTLTINSIGATTITSLEQLSGHKAATISGSSSAQFLTKSNIKTIGANSLEDAMLKLQNKEVDAVVYDRPQLLYYLKNNKSVNEHLYISKAEYYKQGYGFAFPFDSELVYSVNRTLLALAENQEIENIVHLYIQKDE
ncbi:transporter substrate-binding domain-containing protein [Bizionia paragorgiae]|uniref:Amino acid ABC transporter substrate-binding protein, PAAT family n=1 Tax=Bizionia paragorgiae TaxID=283786 RepID=A0A1H3VDB6_BIZPA|nr:transporter substrate-binding domain-containing protein [Bizionia paragorgiae]SDZ72729.1 amino acid ABC transporter substrate-binding protein, PAAT family [Bizionia paragorgiae]